MSQSNILSKVTYVAAPAGSPGARQLYRTAGRGGAGAACLTCSGAQQWGNCTPPSIPCTYNEITLAPDQSAYLQRCLGPGLPTTLLFSLPDNTCLAVLDSNTRLAATVARAALPRYKHLDIGTELSTLQCELCVELQGWGTAS